MTNLVCVDTVHFHVIALFEKFDEKRNPPKVSCGNRFFSVFQMDAVRIGLIVDIRALNRHFMSIASPIWVFGQTLRGI